MTSACHEIKYGFKFSYQHFICQFVLTCVQVNINIREFDFVECSCYDWQRCRSECSVVSTCGTGSSVPVHLLKQGTEWGRPRRVQLLGCGATALAAVLIAVSTSSYLFVGILQPGGFRPSQFKECPVQTKVDFIVCFKTVDNKPQKLSHAKDNPWPLLLAPVRRFGLLGCSWYQPTKWPQLGGTPGLLPPGEWQSPVAVWFNNCKSFLVRTWCWQLHIYSSWRT